MPKPTETEVAAYLQGYRDVVDALGEENVRTIMIERMKEVGLRSRFDPEVGTGFGGVSPSVGLLRSPREPSPSGPLPAGPTESNLPQSSTSADPEPDSGKGGGEGQGGGWNPYLRSIDQVYSNGMAEGLMVALEIAKGHDNVNPCLIGDLEGLVALSKPSGSP